MRCPYCGYKESKVVDSRPADESSSIRQSFDRSKVLRGIQRSCEKRPVPVADMERMALEIEQELQNALEREVSTEYIGELVMDKLRAVDEVAYVRFASVYRQFKDIDTFMKELNKLLESK